MPGESRALRGTSRRLAKVLLVVELLGIAWLVLNPSPAAPSRAVSGISRLVAALGLPQRAADPVLWEFVLNIALFVPLTFLALLLWPRLGIVGWTVLGGILSAYLELSQWLLLPTRSPTLSDLVANTSGGLIGAVLAAATAVLLPRQVWARVGEEPQAGQGARHGHAA